MNAPTRPRLRYAPVFEPLTAPARYKGAWGGRGSGKSHFFAGLLVIHALRHEGLRAVCVREIQRSLRQSAKALIEAKIWSLGPGVASRFRIYREVIATPGDGIIIFEGLRDYNAQSIKSLEGFDRAWIEEAQCLSSTSLVLLRPTIRAPGSEIWASWNPRLKSDPVDRLLRADEPPTGAVVVKANWRDNIWFTPELEAERQDCLRMNPEQYEHIWEGGYLTWQEGAYFARALAEAREEGRIGAVAADPLMTIQLFCDIGGTGARSDAFAIWAAQFIGKEIRVLDHYEAQGQELGHHLNWLRSRDYTPDRAQIWLPHDGATHDRIYSVSYESALREAGYRVNVVPNQGPGAAAARIEAARRKFPAVWFNEASCTAGLEALGWYHERRDAARGIGLGPEHDWSSHAADAFGLMCVAHEEPRKKRPMREGPAPGPLAWMG